MDTLKIIGIPYDASSSFMRGPAQGPDAIRKALHGGSSNYWTQNMHNLTELWEKADLGNLKLPSEDPEEVFPIIQSAVYEQLNQGHKVLSMGGDHSVAWPIMKAYSSFYPELHILQIDAHGDLYDNFEGSPYSHACPFARIMEEKLATSLTQIGIRTLNEHQVEQAEKFGVHIIEMKHFSLDNLPKLRGPLYISLDLDAFDPAFAPGVSHHEPGGFTVREILEVLDKIDIPVVGADVVELNPQRDPLGITTMLGAKMLKELASLLLHS